ncbi:MAG: hypothetical protein PUK24_01015 [Elusimicrobia bacterium]|nr:hypothetical protein [Elusimicrobiota bacterium]MDY6039701.1 hypothetical protein [Elusimicrobiaceae bacterium]
MRVLLAFSLCLFIGASSAQAQGWRNFLRLPSLSSKALSVAQRRVIVSNYSANISRITAANRLNLAATQIPMLERSLKTYYKSVSHHLPAISAKPMNAAINTLEELSLSLPASLKADPFFSRNISNGAMEAYLAAQMADAWGNWLANAAGEHPTFEAEVSSSEIKAAKQVYRELSSNFKKLYDALPAEDKDLSAQLSRVLTDVAQTTGWNEEVMGSLEVYFQQVMKTFLNKQGNLTMTEFLQAYDVLAVASEVGGRYLHRMEGGASSLPLFLLIESVQRVKNNLAYGMVPSKNSARAQRLTRWYEAILSPSRVVSQSAN